MQSHFPQARKPCGFVLTGANQSKFRKETFRFSNKAENRK
jgi:hypothetical protein